MKTIWKMTIAVLLATVMLSEVLSAPAETLAPASLQTKRQAQERARTMARELVSSVLDMQLTKLEVNGLDKLPIYGEIALMRKNMDRLIETDMAEVAELLSQAQGLPEAERQKKVDAAREKTRGIVVRLSIERQNLLRRLKLADMAAQVRRLIDLQTVNLRQTETLTAKQATQTLATIQDERDLKALYGQLHNLVRAVSTWGGAEGAVAADGLRILKAARVGEEIAGAIASLEAVKFADAAVREKAVLKGLAALLEKIDEARGLASSDVEGLLKEVAQLTKWQQDLKLTTKMENLSDKAAEDLLQQQSKLHKDLDKFDEALKRIPGADAPLQKAKASAYEATANLFAAKKPEAVKEQDKVLANLATITEQLKKAALQENSAKSADELAELSKRLKNARAALKESEPHQRKAFAKDPAKPETLKENLAEIGKKLAQARGEPELPSQVTSRLDEAKEAVKRAQEKGEPESLNDAKAAVDRATAEVNAAAAETERRQLAVKIGELGRAAEALERAAAHQRDLSDKAAEAAKKHGFTPAEATELHKEQQEVVKVADNTAEGVKNTAPKAAEKLAEANKPIRKVEAELGNAKQTPQAADAVAKEAKKTAKVLEAAAALLRSEIKDTAKALVRVADDQLADLGEVAKEVDKARADLPSADKDQLEVLAEAKKRIAEARTEQQRALGQEKAAKQRDLARKIVDALAQQDRAEQAAIDLTDGKTARTVDAVVAQQKAADQIGELAKEAKDATGEALAKAEKSAVKAAKDLLDGKPHQAEAARKETRAALMKALRDARAQAEKTAAEEEGKPNADAQKRVSDLSREAAQLAKDDAPAAVKHLDKAGEHSQEAEKKLASGEKPGKAQKNTAAALRDAEEQIDKAMRDLAQRQLDQKEGKGEQIAKAADKSAKVDPDALAALRDAEKSAKTKEGSTSSKSELSEMPQTPKSVKETRNHLDKAAVALDNRKAQAERDRALAEEAGRDAVKQQDARNRIDSLSNELAKTDDKEMKRANELNTAMIDFADTERRIGENAGEISKQKDVANQPLRVALEAASKLAKSQDSDKGDDAKTGAENKDGMEPSQNDDKAGLPMNAQLGAGLVPASPEMTAAMIAGAKAAAMAAQAAQAAQQSGSPSASSSPGPGSLSGNAASIATKGARFGGASGSRGADSTAKSKSSQEEPWMAKLPPEIRKAIGANARERPPRGYEELLRRYFQREE